MRPTVTGKSEILPKVENDMACQHRAVCQQDNDSLLRKEKRELKGLKGLKGYGRQYDSLQAQKRKKFFFFSFERKGRNNTNDAIDFRIDHRARQIRSVAAYWLVQAKDA